MFVNVLSPASLNQCSLGVGNRRRGLKKGDVRVCVQEGMGGWGGGGGRARGRGYVLG